MRTGLLQIYEEGDGQGLPGENRGLAGTGIQPAKLPEAGPQRRVEPALPDRSRVPQRASQMASAFRKATLDRPPIPFCKSPIKIYLLPRPFPCLLLGLALATAFPGPATGLSESQIQTLETSKRLTQEIYHHPSFQKPELQSPAWNDPNEGLLSQARLWQDAVAVLYEFFEITRRSYPKKLGGEDLPPGVLMVDYQSNRVRFQMALDRLYRAHLGDSLDGKGRSLISMMEMALKEMDSFLNAIATSRAKQYQDSLLAIGQFTAILHRTFEAPPRGGGGAAPRVPGAITLGLVLGCLIFAFLALWSLLSQYHDILDRQIHQHWERSKMWAYEFNKQFIQIRVQYLVLAPAGLGILLGVLSGSVFGFLLLSAMGALTGFYAPKWLLNSIRQRRGRKIEAQLMDALILLSNALKSGLDLVQGFELVQKELQPPISEEFGLVLKNYQLGTPFETALEGLEERVESRLLSYLVKAVLIQRQVGGNLTRIFDRIVESIREEGKLQQKARALTAQQRMQALVVGFMPWIMFLILFMIQPKLMADFYLKPMGLLVLLGMILWEMIGLQIIRGMANIRV
ncbi:MAG: type II secretion system F family protein [Elusimicrobia bacterium]|nr:type II secretion system F family protein [Elusimicrobiota bacterium]